LKRPYTQFSVVLLFHKLGPLFSLVWRQSDTSYMVFVCAEFETH